MDLSTLARSVENLSASIDHRLSGMDQKLNATDKRLGDVVIPAFSRRAGVAMSRGEMVRGDLIGDGGDSVAAATAREHASIGKFLRGDVDSFAAMAEASDFMAADSMSVGSDPEGGYFVVPQLSNVIRKRVIDVSPLARLARQEVITTGDAFEEPIDVGDIGAEWVGEKDERPTLKASDLKAMRVPVNEIYTNQPVTQRLLDDSRFNIGAWLEDKISDKFAWKEGEAFIHGDGIEKPRGLLYGASSPLADGLRPYFTPQHINTGVGDGFASDQSAVDVLIDTIYALKAHYRANARWLMNSKTAAVIRKFKDADGRFIFSDSSEGITPKLLGFPVEFDEQMPDVGEDLRPIAFGDFKQAYIVVDKPGIRMLRDPYTMKPYVLFYAYRRVGGQLQNGEAVKFVRFAAAG